jgi:cytochrome P450
MGWGQGRHPCIGMRWAKMQQNIILAYALAMFKWSGCDANGQPNPHFAQPTTALNELAPSLPQGLYCKYVPREKI